MIDGVRVGLTPMSDVLERYGGHEKHTQTLSYPWLRGLKYVGPISCGCLFYDPSEAVTGRLGFSSKSYRRGGFTLVAEGVT